MEALLFWLGYSQPFSRRLLSITRTVDLERLAEEHLSAPLGVKTCLFNGVKQGTGFAKDACSMPFFWCVVAVVVITCLLVFEGTLLISITGCFLPTNTASPPFCAQDDGPVVFLEHILPAAVTGAIVLEPNQIVMSDIGKLTRARVFACACACACRACFWVLDVRESPSRPWRRTTPIDVRHSNRCSPLQSMFRANHRARPAVAEAEAVLGRQRACDGGGSVQVVHLPRRFRVRRCLLRRGEVGCAGFCLNDAASP